MKRLLSLLLYLSAAACTIGKVYVPNYLFAQQDSAVWIGEYRGRSYELSVLDSSGIWYNGRLVIGGEDTIKLRGFEKGRDYPSRYNLTPNDTMLRGQVFFMAIDHNADSVEMTLYSEDTLRIAPKMLLYKRRKEQ
ncbi:MAG: hypothetical protein J0M29_02010 [Chitinophagales bacterium]|nr:hypothetical protein [Chitinophagales bacterium]